jgi:hypothetical protein
MRLMKPLFLTIALISSPGCKKILSPVYLLDKPRILAIRSEPITLAPSGQVALDALIYLPPESTAATLEWSWCPRLGGGDTSYECGMTADALTQALDPTGALGVSVDYSLGTDARATFAYPVSPEVLRAACAQSGPGGSSDGGSTDGGGDGVEGGDGSALAGDPGDSGRGSDGGDGVGSTGSGLNCRNGLDVTILLTVHVGGKDLRAIRNLTILLDAPTTTNTNPTINGVGPSATATTDASIALLANMPETSTDVVEQMTPPGPDQAEPSTEQRYESLTLAWYVGAGDLAHATTRLDSALVTDTRDWTALITNSWTPPKNESGMVEIILVARDSREGVGWLVSEISAQPAAE